MIIDALEVLTDNAQLLGERQLYSYLLMSKLLSRSEKQSVIDAWEERELTRDADNERTQKEIQAVLNFRREVL